MLISDTNFQFGEVWDYTEISSNWGSGFEYGGGGYAPANPLDNLGSDWDPYGYNEIFPTFEVTGTGAVPIDNDPPGLFWDPIPIVEYDGPTIGDWFNWGTDFQLPVPPGTQSQEQPNQPQTETPGECDGFWGKIKCALRNMQLGGGTPSSAPGSPRPVSQQQQGGGFDLMMLLLVALLIYAATRK